MKNLVTKKRLFLASFILVAFGFLFSSHYFYVFCFQEGHCWQLWDTVKATQPFLFLFSPLLFFSAVTYFLRDEIFRTWICFTAWWVPISTLLILGASGSGGGSMGIPNVLDQEFIAIILMLLFSLISVILIAYKFFTLRKR